jgi:hypothetical protein
MRIHLLAVCALMAVPLTASAQAISPNFTAADKARFAKITPLVGNWTCNDTGQSKPYTATVKVEGAWLVWRDKSNDEAMEYVRWSHTMQSYVVTEITRSGALNVSTTTDPDPLNASWKRQFPPPDNIMSTSFSNGIFTVSVKFVDKSGKSRTGKLVCKKVS